LEKEKGREPIREISHTQINVPCWKQAAEGISASKQKA